MQRTKLVVHRHLISTKVILYTQCAWNTKSTWETKSIELKLIKKNIFNRRKKQSLWPLMLMIKILKVFRFGKLCFLTLLLLNKKKSIKYGNSVYNITSQLKLSHLEFGWNSSSFHPSNVSNVSLKGSLQSFEEIAGWWH